MASVVARIERICTQCGHAFSVRPKTLKWHIPKFCSAECHNRSRQDIKKCFWNRVTKTPNCWVWEGTINAKTGYGSFQLNRKTRLVHRFSYESFKGIIPEGLRIDHLCRNRACVNPDHLEAVTPRENTLRGQTLPAANARKTHCPKGHPLLIKKNGRYCSECKRKSSRDWKLRSGYLERRKLERAASNARASAANSRMLLGSLKGHI